MLSSRMGGGGGGRGRELMVDLGLNAEKTEKLITVNLNVAVIKVN